MAGSSQLVDLIDRIRARLSSVDFYVGEHDLPAARADAVSQARAFPLPIVSAGTAAYEAAGDPGKRAHAQIMTAIGLYWWGYHREAQIWLEDVQGASDADANYLDWYRFLCDRLQRRKRDRNDDLLATADALDRLGDTAGAWQCRQDAALEWTFYDAERALDVLNGSGAFLEQAGRIADVCLGKLRMILVHISSGDVGAVPMLFDDIDALIDADQMRGLDSLIDLYRGKYAIRTGQLEDAERYTQRALAKAEAFGHSYYQALALLDLALRHMHRGEAEELRQYTERGLVLALDLEWTHGIASMTLELGNHKLFQGDYAGARERYLQARTQYDALDETLFSAIATMNLGIVAHSQNVFSDALTLMETARRTFDELNSSSYLALANHNLGKIYASYGMVEEAVSYFETSISVLHKAEMDWQAVRSQIFLARIMMDRPDAPDHLRADYLLQMSRTQAESKGLGQDMALVVLAEGDLAYRQAQYATALERYGQAVEEMEGLHHLELANEARLGIAAAHLRRMEIDEARECLAALDFDSLPAVLKWRYHFLQARLHLLRGDISSARAAYLAAIRYLRQARIGIANDDERAHFVFRLHHSFDEAFAFAERLGDAGLALQIVESISGSSGYGAAEDDPAAAEDGDAFLTQVRDRLKDRYGEAWCILRFYRHGTHFFVFTITARDVTLAPIADLRFDDPAVLMCANPDDSFRRRVYDDLERRGIVSGVEMRRRLYDAFLRPVLPDRLGPDHVLLVIPSRELHGLPFHALLDGDEALAARTQVAYAQSLTALAGLLDQPVRDTPLLDGPGVILAQSTFRDGDFADLAYVQAEAEAIAGQAIGPVTRAAPEALDEAMLYEIVHRQGPDACQWLHLATHSDYDRRQTLSSGLVIGDDLISIETIRRWKTTIRLVTMSACQTASWHWMHGEIIVSLTSAFLEAGAETVIASQWDVYDQTTAGLMTRLYERLAAGDQPAKALATVQREMHREGISPYYWATFGVYGLP